MAFTIDPQFEHLIRRAGFGARPDELDAYRKLSITGAVDALGVQRPGLPDAPTTPPA